MRESVRGELLFRSSPLIIYNISLFIAFFGLLFFLTKEK